MAKARKPRAPAEGQLFAFDDDALDTLIGGRTTAAEVEELFRQMKRAVMERILCGELTHHLGYKPGEAKPDGQTNQRNGRSAKTVLTDDGALPVAIPRDRDGTFEPLLIPKHERRLPRFDQNVISLYARGMTVREIQGHLEELYQVAGHRLAKMDVPIASAGAPEKSDLIIPPKALEQIRRLFPEDEELEIGEPGCD